MQTPGKNSDAAVKATHVSSAAMKLSATAVSPAPLRATAASTASETILIAGTSDGASPLATVTALAAEKGRSVLRVDLAAVAGKYIGETEKNLEQLFRRAEAAGAVLFFDEADALFGKRSDVRDAHDRYANLEVSYLLAQLENFRGVAVIATTAEPAMDDALLRRFQRVIRPLTPKPPSKL